MVIRGISLLLFFFFSQTIFSQTNCQLDLVLKYQKAKEAYSINQQPLIAFAYLKESFALLKKECPALSLSNKVMFNDSLLALAENILIKETGSGTYKSLLKILQPFFLLGLETYFDYYKLHPNTQYAEKIIQLIEKNKAITQKLSNVIPSRDLFILKNKINFFKEVKQKENLNINPDYSIIRTADDSINHYVAKLDGLTEMELLFTNDHQITIKHIQKKMKDDEAFILYQKQDDFLYFAIVITKQAKVLCKLPSQIAYPKQIQHFLSHKNQNYDAFLHQSTALYNTLFKPLVDITYNKKRLFIIRDGNLNKIPIDALISGLPSKMDGNFGKLAYLVKDFSIVYLNTIQSLLSRNSAKQFITKPLIFSPIFDSFKPKQQEIPPIKTSENFINYLKKEYAITPYQREQATISNFKKQGKSHSFIHLDTHTFFDNQNIFNQSKVAFAPEYNSNGVQISNGLLSLNDIYLLDITPKILLLGSCNTGTGRNEIGEGIISVAYNFRLKGIKNIIYTSWSVEETATHEIFKIFYDHLNIGMPIDYALQLAKIEYLKQNSSWKNASNAAPYYWAGLALNGIPSLVKIQSNNTIKKLKEGAFLLSLLFLVFYCLWRKRKKLILG